MDNNAGDLGTSTTELLKLVVVAVVLAIVVSAGRSAIAPLFVDRPLERNAQEHQVTQLAHRHATSYVVQFEPEELDPL